MDYLITIIFFISLSIILRALRAKTILIDVLATLIIIVCPLIMWWYEDWKQALLLLVILILLVPLIFGMYSKTNIYWKGKNNKLICPKCNYNKLEILDVYDYTAIAKCKRCKTENSFPLQKEE